MTSLHKFPTTRSPLDTVLLNHTAKKLIESEGIKFVQKEKTEMKLSYNLYSIKRLGADGTDSLLGLRQSGFCR